MLRKQIEDELLGLSTHQGSSRNLQERTNLSSLPMEVCLCVLRLQTWLFWRYTDSSKNVSGAIGSHLQFKTGICQAGILLASYVSYPALCAHCLPCLQPPFLQHFTLLHLFSLHRRQLRREQQQPQLITRLTSASQE